MQISINIVRIKSFIESEILKFKTLHNINSIRRGLTYQMAELLVQSMLNFCLKFFVKLIF